MTLSVFKPGLTFSFELFNVRSISAPAHLNFSLCFLDFHAAMLDIILGHKPARTNRLQNDWSGCIDGINQPRRALLTCNSQPTHWYGSM